MPVAHFPQDGVKNRNAAASELHHDPAGPRLGVGPALAASRLVCVKILDSAAQNAWGRRRNSIGAAGATPKGVHLQFKNPVGSELSSQLRANNL